MTKDLQARDDNLARIISDNNNLKSELEQLRQDSKNNQNTLEKKLVDLYEQIEAKEQKIE